MTATNSKWWIAAGIFLVVLSVYLLTSPGRIDIVDGQARFDVSYNLVVNGRPVVTDPWIQSIMTVGSGNGTLYSHYGAPGSVFPMPLVWLGLHQGRPDRELSRFLFSMASPIFGAGISFVLFLFFLELGVSVPEAIMWTLVSAFATLVWPASNSSFDNTQHAFFTITALYLGFLSARRNSTLLAAAAGLSAAVLILYQEYFLIIIPALGMATLNWKGSQPQEPQDGCDGLPKSRFSGWLAGVRNDLRSLYALHRAAVRGSGAERASYLRFLVYTLTAVAIGFLLTDVYNKVRFGSYFDNGKMIYAAVRGYPMVGNPLAGFSALLLSPGKSVFLYSPPLILGLLGIGRLRRGNCPLAIATVVASVALVALLSCIAFPGGDWCWGPRYLVVLLPLWALAMPFGVLESRARRELLFGIVALGVVVQMLALSVEDQRFFFARGLNDFFWAEDPWFYFKHSALFARIGETISLKNGVPPTATLFNCIPKKDWYTYTLMGPPLGFPRNLSAQWMLHFKVYYLPRPWPLWMSTVAPGLRPIHLQAWVTGLITLGLLGLGFICKGYRLVAPRARSAGHHCGAGGGIVSSQVRSGSPLNEHGIFVRASPESDLELTILLPCLNERETLETCIRKALAFLERHQIRGEVLVSDNGSEDGSQEIGWRCGARVVHVPVRGYGAALIHGSRDARGTYIVMADSDDSYDLSNLLPFLEKLRAGYDLVMGNRLTGGIKPGAMRWKNRWIGTPALSGIGRLFFDCPVGDFNCGLRAYSAEAFRRMDLRSPGMEFASEMIIKATLFKMKIAEVPTTLSPDGRSRPPHLRPWRDGWRHLRFMLLYSPRWLFLYPGLLLVVAGLLAMGWLLPGPRRLGGVTLDVHTLFFCAIGVLVGFQAMLFAVFGQTFAVSEGLLPAGRGMDKIARLFNMEIWLSVGALLFLVGLGGAINSMVVWERHDFGALVPSQLMRVAIPAGLAMALGCQTMLSAFFLELLRLRRV